MSIERKYGCEKQVHSKSLLAYFNLDLGLQGINVYLALNNNDYRLWVSVPGKEAHNLYTSYMDF